MLNVIDCLGNDKVCFLLCLSQFQSVTYFAGLKELYIYLDIHVVGGKDWSFKIVVEKNNAKDKWQLIKGCGSFFWRGGLEWQSDMFLCIVGWFISTMDSGLLGQAVQYHGPELVRCLQIEQQQVPVSLTDHLNKYRQRQPNTSRSEQFLRIHFKITA